MGSNLEGTELSDIQKRSITFSKNIGKRLARENPEIVEEYRSGKTLIQLANEFSFLDIISSESIAISAVHYALAELMGDDELKRVSHEHFVRNGKIRGTYAAKIHQEKGTNIWGYTSKQLAEYGTKGALACGYVLFSKEKRDSEYGAVSEIEYAEKLRDSGLVWRVVAERTNKLFDHDRTPNTFSAHFSKKNRKK